MKSIMVAPAVIFPVALPFMIHIPKTGTTTVSYQLGMCRKPFNAFQQSAVTHSHKKYKGAFLATTLRHPVERFESFLSYRQDENRGPRNDWRRLRLPWQAPLNTIVGALANGNVDVTTAFQPYGSMQHYLRGNQVLVFCSTDDTLAWATGPTGLFPHCNITTERKNKSSRKHGTLNSSSVKFLESALAGDMALWQLLCAKRTGGIVYVP